MDNRDGTSANGTRYSVGGAEGAPVVAFIHGLGLNRQIWARYMARVWYSAAWA